MKLQSKCYVTVLLLPRLTIFASSDIFYKLTFRYLYMTYGNGMASLNISILPWWPILEGSGRLQGGLEGGSHIV